jgi:hypothetical protein
MRIKEEHPDFYDEWIGPGFDIIKAYKLCDAKLKQRAKNGK